MDIKPALIGKLVDIGGKHLHLAESGEGSPTVIFDSGMGGNMLDWCLVQPEIARFTRTVAYDRLGLGWSDPIPPDVSRSSQDMVEELYALLTAAQVPPPYIYVGHSLGGLNARLFADKHPAEFAGAVLVDATHEDELSSRFPSKYVEGFEAQRKGMASFVKLAKLGLLSLMVKLNMIDPTLRRVLEKFPAETGRMYRYFYAQPDTMETLVREMSDIKVSYAQARQIGLKPGSWGNRPLVVLKHGIHDKLPRGVSEEVIQDYIQAFTAVQNELAALSTNSQLVTAEKSGHAIHMEQPELVIQAVQEVVRRVRA